MALPNILNILPNILNILRPLAYERLTEVVFTQDQVRSWRPSNQFAPEVKVLGSAVCFQLDPSFEIGRRQTLMAYPFQWLVSLIPNVPPGFTLRFNPPQPVGNLVQPIQGETAIFTKYGNYKFPFRNDNPESSSLDFWGNALANSNSISILGVVCFDYATLYSMACEYNNSTGLCMKKGIIQFERHGNKKFQTFIAEPKISNIQNNPVQPVTVNIQNNPVEPEIGNIQNDVTYLVGAPCPPDWIPDEGTVAVNSLTLVEYQTLTGLPFEGDTRYLTLTATQIQKGLEFTKQQKGWQNGVEIFYPIELRSILK